MDNTQNDFTTGLGKVWLMLTIVTNYVSLIDRSVITWIVGIVTSMMAIRYYYYATKKLKNKE